MADSVSGTTTPSSNTSGTTTPSAEGSVTLKEEEKKRDENVHEDSTTNESKERIKVLEAEKFNGSGSKIAKKRFARKRRSDNQKNQVTVKIPPGAKDKKKYLQAAAKDAADKTNAPAEAKEAQREAGSGAGGPSQPGIPGGQQGQAGGSGGGNDATDRPGGSTDGYTPPPSWATSQPPPIPPTGTNPDPPQPVQVDESRETPQRLERLGLIPKNKPNISRPGPGGQVRPGTFALANGIVDAVGKDRIERFTSWNHGRHTGWQKVLAGRPYNGKISAHYDGRAFDIIPADKSGRGYRQLTDDINRFLRQNGIDGYARDECANPSSESSGCHVHVQSNSPAAAERARQIFGSGGARPFTPGQPADTERVQTSREISGSTPTPVNGVPMFSPNKETSPYNGIGGSSPTGYGGITTGQIRTAIANEAQARGVDVPTALRVFGGEGISNYSSLSGGSRWGLKYEPSDGPFQLLQGEGTPGPRGLGDQFKRETGIDPRYDRSPNSILKQIQFALNNVVRNGWGAWAGAKAQGITGKQGVGPNARTLEPVGGDFIPGGTPRDDFTSGRGGIPESQVTHQNGVGVRIDGTGATPGYTSDPGSGGPRGSGARAAGGAYRGSPGTGLYPSTPQGIRVNTANNPYAAGFPLEAIFSLAQYFQQNVPGFQSVQSFTNPPANVINNGNIAPYTNGLAIDFTIVNPTIESSITATQVIFNFLEFYNIGCLITNFYLTASPITSGYIHVEITGGAYENLSFALTFITNRNLGIVIDEDIGTNNDY